MGRVKTRLAAEIGASAATRFARIAAASLIRRLGRDGRWRMVLAVAPDSAIASPIWPADVTRVGQGRGDLGARMGRLLTHRSGPRRKPDVGKIDAKGSARRSGRGRWLASGKIDAKGALLPSITRKKCLPIFAKSDAQTKHRSKRRLSSEFGNIDAQAKSLSRSFLGLPTQTRLGPAILIGADIPAISAALIAAAFAVLRRHDAIFGPAEDGGYWLVGLNGRAPRGDMFANVRWSSPFALADTLANFRKSRVGYAAMLGDVDDAASYRRLGHLAGRVILPAGSHGGG